MPTLDYDAILQTAFAAADRATPERISACGRIYVCIVDKAHGRGIARAAKKLGKIYQGRGHYGVTNALYVGYDNATGREFARGTAIVAVLVANGIRAYRDEHGD